MPQGTANLPTVPFCILWHLHGFAVPLTAVEHVAIHTEAVTWRAEYAELDLTCGLWFLLLWQVF